MVAVKEELIEGDFAAKLNRNVNFSLEANSGTLKE